jgi:ABC-2 type transport system ATP-binding protein
VLVFDEPTNGLDPVGIAETRELIKELSGAGKTILLASHLLDEVEKVCTHVAILQRGVLLTAGPVNEVLTNEEFVELGAEPAELAVLQQLLKGLSGVKQVQVKEDHLQLYFQGAGMDPADINRYCFEKGVVLRHLQLRKKSLETKFMELTK